MNELTKRTITSLGLFILLFLSTLSLDALVLIILLINFLAFEEFIKIFKKIFKNNYFLQTLLILIALLYLTYFSLVTFIYLSEYFEVNKINVLFIILICISTDIGGYFFGKLIGGKKLTKISPKKTYSGLVGSIFLSLVVGNIFYFIKDNFFNLNITLIIFIITISLISQFGDLMVSFLKRKAKIKDTGNILPGHGGILDRIDGLLFALPFGIFLF